MIEPGESPPTPRTVRIVHGAMVLGLILFAIVAHFVLTPNANPAGALAPQIPLLLGLSLAGSVASILLSMRVARASDEVSDEAFWKAAGQKTMICWALLEGSALLAIVVYGLLASRAAITVAVVIIVIMAFLNPGYFERR